MGESTSSPAMASAQKEDLNAAVDGVDGDWRSQLRPDFRERILNKIFDDVQKHMNVADPGLLRNLKSLVEQFEMKIFATAISSDDYLKKIAKKITSLEKKSKGAVNPSPPNPAVGNKSPLDSAVQPQHSNLGQSLTMPLVNQPQVQQPLSQNLQNHLGQSPTMNNMSGVSQNSVRNTPGQSVGQHSYANAQTQIQGRHQHPLIMSQQQNQSQNQHLYQQQLQHQLLNQKTQHRMMQSSSQSVARQHQGHHTMHRQSSPLQEHATLIAQKPVLPSQQQQMTDMQQPQRLSSQQNNLMNLPQKQLIGSQSSTSSRLSHECSMHMLQQAKAVSQQPNHPSSLIILESQGHLSQHKLPPQQLMAPINSHSPQFQQQQLKSSQREMHQRVQAPGAILQSRNAFELHNHLTQSQRGLQEVSSSSPFDSGVQSDAGADNWQEEIFQKMKSLKELYVPELKEIHKKLAMKTQQFPGYESLAPSGKQSDHHVALKNLVEKTLRILHISKSNIQLRIRDKLPDLERQIAHILAISGRTKNAPSQIQTQQQFQHPPKLEATQGSSFQQGSTGPVQQGTLPSHVGPSPPDSNLLQHQLVKQEKQEVQEQLMQAQHMKQMQQLHQQKQVQATQLHQPVKHERQEEQEQLMQAQQMKQKMLQRQMLTQQQLHPQKSMQATQMPGQQLPQLHQKNDVRQGTGIKPGLHQQHLPVGQHPNYLRLKSVASLPVSSPQSSQATPSQPFQYVFPRFEQQSMLSSHQKAGSPLQSANSPLVVPSCSSPVAPSPIPGDSEKISANPTTTKPVSLGHEPQTQALVIDTCGISASPLLAEFVGLDGNQAKTFTSVPSTSRTTEHPLDLLIKLVESLPSETLSSSIRDIRSVVNMVDSLAGSAPYNGSRYPLGENLAATTKRRLYFRNIPSQGVSMITKRKLRRDISAMPLNAESADGSISDLDTFELESIVTSNAKRQRVEAKNHALIEEIRTINQGLIDTVVSFRDEDHVHSVAAASAGDEGKGTVIKFSFCAVSVSPNLKSHFSSIQMSPIVPLRLLVPDDYPKSSPIFLDELPTEPSKEFEDLSIKAQSTFSRCVCDLVQPMSLGEMARLWDSCMRKVIREYAQQNGGGSFSSRYGTWQSCVGA